MKPSKRWLLAPWNESHKLPLLALEKTLRAIGHETSWVSREVESRAELLSAIGSRKFGALATWQRFFDTQTDIRDALRENRVRTVVCDYGFFPHYSTFVLDDRVENASSGLRDKAGSLYAAAPREYAVARRRVHALASRVSRRARDYDPVVSESPAAAPLQLIDRAHDEAAARL